MAGTHEGGIKARETMIKDMGEEEYYRYVSERGRNGGKAPKSTPGGFAVMDRKKHAEISRKGGKASRSKK